MKWASSISTGETIEQCIQETAKAVREQMGDNEIHLTVMFVSPHFKDKLPQIPKLLREQLSIGTLLGCTGGGIIGGGQEVEQQHAFSLTCAHLPGVKIQEIQTDTMALPDPDTAPSVWREWLGVPAESNPHFILLADPFSFRGEEFLAGMDFAYPNSAKVGGLASGSHFQGGNVMYIGDRMYNNGLIGLALSGNIQLDTIVAQGCRPIGTPMSITKCNDYLLEEVDNKPPIQVLEEMVETMSENDRKLMQTSLFLGIEMDPLKDDPGQGDFLIRNLIGVDRETGALSIGAPLREGQLVQFHLRDKVMSAEDLNVMLSKYSKQGRGDDACGALLFSCLGRGQYLYGEANHDCNVFKDKLGAIPLGGFFCNGEIGPVGQNTFLHGYTSSFGIFRPAPGSV
ncbi:FIST signal transduction protein [Nitrospina sp. 32_T5]|uniref:FIST signal transduction protein n=1 Tax=unclassified Nitrospina TaxID=2638683 RepID=UPI003F9B3163